MLMAKLLRLRPVAAALLLSLTLSACAGGTRRPPLFGKRHKPVNGVKPTLLVATRDELNAKIAGNYDAIRSFQATNVDLTASKGSVYQGDIFDYPAVSGIILFRKPNSIHVRATYSALGVLLFDMVSDGTNFRLHLPKANPNPLFMAGLNSAPATSASKMENFRPDAFLSSMLIRPWDPATESIMLKDDTDEDDALYRLEFNRKGPDGAPIPGREVWFDRLDNLVITRQKIYNDNGDILSDTAYGKWESFSGVTFPTHIDLSRPKDGYGVQIDVDKSNMLMNKELTDQQFVLEQPEGTTFREIH
jgi:hypothetical protein